MKYLWIIVFIAATYAANTLAQYDNDADYWQDYEWYDNNSDLFENFNGDAPEDNLKDVPNAPQQQSVENNDDNVKEENNDALSKEDGKPLEEPVYDYQIEDNRSEAKEPSNVANEEPSLNINDDLIKQLENDNNVDEAQQDFNILQQILGDKNNIDDEIEKKILYVDEKSLMDINDLLPEEKKDNVDEPVEPLLIDNNNEELPNEFNKDDTNSLSFEDQLPEIELKAQPDVDEIIEDTRKILADIDDQFDNSDNKNSEKETMEDSNNKDEEILIPEEDNNEKISDPSNEEDIDALTNEKLSEIVNSMPNMDAIVDETRKILAESDNNFENKEDANIENNFKEDIKESENKLIQEDENDKPNLELPIEEEQNDSVAIDLQDVNNIDDGAVKLDFDRQDDNHEDGQISNNSEDIMISEDKNNKEIAKSFEEDPQQQIKKIIEETRKILDESSNQFEEDKNKESKDAEDVVGDAEMKKMIEETLKALEESNFQNYENDDDVENNSSEKEHVQNMKNIIDETNKILEEELKKVDKSNGSPEQDTQEELISDNKETADENEDDFNRIYKDLHADLDNLLETWKKLSNDDYVLEEVNPDDALDKENDNVLDYEEKFGRPYGEGKVLSQRDDYYEAIDDENLSKIFADGKSEEVKSDQGETLQKLVDTLVENKDDIEPDNAKNDDTPILYVNDALVAVDDDVPQPEDSEPKVPVKTMSIEKLSDSELDQLMSQFTLLHGADIEIKADNFNRDVAPVHIKLSVDEPTIVTSPNYPNPYPTNNIIDWMFDGEGVGIELNITDFNVNSALGDYLLVKPGSIDDSGDNGLVFAYHLNEERRYRFTDVDQLFMRFESKPGMVMRRGFQLSLRMIAPPREEPEELPEPEPVVPRPNATMTLYLGGLNVTEFESVRESFRLLLASMATLYINENDIELGANATSFVTQITRTYICKVNWPGFENCVEVQFSIPLVYEDDRDHRLNENDLNAMWYTYSTRDPFATRLQSMGITEFSTPNDGTILMLWLILAAGVLICVMMLAFALWKFSCFENYTRMQTYSETDIMHNEKRHLDMYPAPHQTLPPLFTENNYKWHDSNFEDTTRVDMGGFTNRSFARDERSDESDEDNVNVTRDRSRQNVGNNSSFV